MEPADSDLEKQPSQETASDDDTSQSQQQQQQQEVVEALASQAFHLPGNETAWQDWKQYIGNNHPVLGICLHHPWHPAAWWARVLCLVTSAVFGLVLTNIVWLWAYNNHERNDSLAFNLDVGDTIGQGVRNTNTTATQYLLAVDESNQVQVTADMIFLWTVGGAIHGWFDNIIWTCTVCTCCSFSRLDKYQRYGTGLVTLVLLVITAAATLTVVMRVALENDQEAQTDWQELQSAGLFDDAVDLSSLTDVTNTAQYKEFLMATAVELCLALVFHYPLVAVILFTGVLNVKGRFPFVGGRPEELRRMQGKQDNDDDCEHNKSGKDETKTRTIETASKEKSSNRNAEC